MVDGTSDGEATIRKIYNKKQIPPPEFLYLLDKGLLDTLIRIEAKSSSDYNKLVLWLKNRYMYCMDYCDKKDIRVPGLLRELAISFWRKFLNAPR
jgi:hypothetical protein